MEDRTWNAFENRCDACGAESFFKFERLRVLNEVEIQVQDFFFCGHHGKRYEAQLMEIGFDADDYTSFINPEPSISANA